ncbi:hypothetical protein EST38_g10239 [Candolleomyces aberdarensis]|uniref:G domain-containing protein n=1 Tax=Candolleomyces aberdarensis TaxID=2316362 RepID=A0A4Q2D7W9_9AGAR|nr:hypothetical protein EST38_g10239 [Candolleomyces aberdarensis]
MAPRNIVFFGESGHGKSSVINMVLGYEKAATSSSAMGCTFKSTAYTHQLSGHDLVLWDTAGLNEGDQGTVTDMKAVTSLYTLLKKLEGGVSLLVFCIRAPRINDAAHKNWQLFQEIICQKRVPIVMAVTHLENEDSMDDWWMENENRFRRYGMNPCSEYGSGVACITASKGKVRKGGRHAFQDEYDESQDKIRQLIVDNHLRTPWSVRPVDWFQTVYSTTVKTNYWGKKVEEITEKEQIPGRGVFELASRWGISLQEAENLARILEGH